MSAAEYFDLVKPAAPVIKRAPVAELPQEKFTPSGTKTDIVIKLEEALYTGQALTGHWRFVFSMAGKHWISNDMQLYFGHNQIHDNVVFKGPLAIVEQRLIFDMDVNASNRFGDVLHKNEHIRQCITDDRNEYHALISLEHNWTRLMLRLGIYLA